MDTDTDTTLAPPPFCAALFRTKFKFVKDDGLGEAFVVNVYGVILAAACNVIATAGQAHKVFVVGVALQGTGACILCTWKPPGV